MELDQRSHRESQDASEAARLAQAIGGRHSPTELSLDPDKGQTDQTIEGAIAQAGSRLSEGTFSLEHLEDFLALIEGK